MMTTRILKDHRTLLALTLLLCAVWLKGIYAVSSGSTDTDFGSVHGADFVPAVKPRPAWCVASDRPDGRRGD